MSNTLVINLTRFGDLLQTQPLLTHLKQKGEYTGLVCLENFAPAAGLLRDVDRVFPLPGALFLRDLDRSWVKAVQSVTDWRNSVQDRISWDRLINLTSSLSAKILARAVSANEKSGFSVDEFGFGSFSNKWSIFLEASSGFRGSSPFNVADIFLRVAGVDCCPPFELKRPQKEVRERMLRVLANRSPAGCTGFVGFQLGASAEQRRWPVSSFAELGGLVWERYGLCPVLLGSDSETGLARRYGQNSRSPAVSLVGETGLEELAAVLKEIRVLVTNDTGTMHLAAGLHTPLMAFFLATAQPWDTAPYQEGCLCLEPETDCHPCAFNATCTRDYACRQAISAHTAFDMLEAFLKCGKWPEYSGLGVRPWITAKRSGFMDLKGLSAENEDDRTRWMRIQKRAYSAFLEDVRPDSRGLKRPSPEFVYFVREEAGQLRSLFELVRTRGEMLVRSPRPAMHKKFMSNWFQVGRMLEESEIFPILALLWKVHSQDAGRDMQQFLHVCRSYEQLLGFFGTEFV